MSIARLRSATIFCLAMLVHSNVWAATIPVADGAVAINPDGNCSLVEAIENANAGTQPHADCAPGSFGEDIVLLASNGSYAFDVTTADIPITTTVMIDGNLATLTHSAGGFFDIGFFGFLKLVRATVRGSVGTDSSAISGIGSLFIADCILEENINQTGGGGAIFMEWPSTGQIAEIRNSIFRNNVSGDSGGAIKILQYSMTASSSAVFEGLTFEGNGRWILSGGVETVNGGALSISGVSAGPTLSVTINRSRFESNDASSSGGAIRLFGSSVELTMDRTTVDGNSAEARGGGIYSEGSVVTIMRSLISNNTTVASGPGIIRGGGGFANFVGNVTVINSTFSGNVAGEGGGAILNLSSSASATPSVVSLLNVTVTGNEAQTESLGGGIHNVDSGNGPATVNLQNTLVLGNTAPTSNFDCRNDGGTMQSTGYNVKNGSALAGCNYSAPGDVSATGAASTDVNSPLADNGGDTLTHSIPFGSEAKNIIPAGVNGCDADYVDQRNRLRNSGNGTADCDAGAYEYGALTEVCPDDLLLDYQTLTGPEPPFEATSSATLGPSLGIDGSGIEVNAPMVSIVSPTSIDGSFEIGNTTSCP